ncbi:MAG: ABC transporter permease subunit [Candidatus Latescibacteria bacterium]|nr:ABC transporter permease subunit [Candidatus Latescibacterota bacterium]NIO57406.1 ABC transporter permease subunit [Candidatus Latescibacterota bacterium]
MNSESRTPTSAQVIAAIARREITLAMRRRLVKLLFLGNLLPPLVMGVILVVNTLVRGAGIENLEWDPLARLLQIQIAPVLFLALGIGTPLVARDRREDVLFLYATRPVTPWSYTAGKMLAVAVPALALLVIPAILIAILRMGLKADFGLLDSITLITKVVLVAVLVACGYSGVSVGPSAATKKARWALLLALMCFVIPSVASDIIWGHHGYALDPGQASEDVISALFDNDNVSQGVVGAFALVVWGVLGSFVTATRIRREMIP